MGKINVVLNVDKINVDKNFSFHVPVFGCEFGCAVWSHRAKIFSLSPTVLYGLTG